VEKMYYTGKVTSDEGLVTHSFGHLFKALLMKAKMPLDTHDFNCASVLTR